MHKIIVSAGMANPIIKLLDGYKDETISCTYEGKTGINCLFNVESELAADAVAAYIKKMIKGTPEGATLYFSVKPQ